MKPFNYAVVGAFAAGLTGLGGVAHATSGANTANLISNSSESCTQFFASTNGGVEQAPSASQSGCGTVGSVVTSATTAVAAAVASSIASVVSARAGGSFGNATGSTGQGASAPFGVWANFSGISFDDKNASVNSEGDAYIGTLGADYRVLDNLLVGAAIAYERVEVDANPLQANGVAPSADNTGSLGNSFDSDAFTFAPYAAFQINDIFSVSGTGGVSWGEAEINQQSIDEFNALDDGSTNTTDLFRYFISATAAANTVVNNFTVGGNLSLLYLENTIDGYTRVNESGQATAVAEQTSELGRLGLGGKVGYLISGDGTTVEPFVRAEYRYDFTRTEIQGSAAAPAHPNDKHAFVIGGGVNMFAGDFGSGGFDLSYELGREEQTEFVYSLTYRLQF